MTISRDKSKVVRKILIIVNLLFFIFNLFFFKFNIMENRDYNSIQLVLIAKNGKVLSQKFVLNESISEVEAKLRNTLVQYEKKGDYLKISVGESMYELFFYKDVLHTIDFQDSGNGVERLLPITVE